MPSQYGERKIIWLFQENLCVRIQHIPLMKKCAGGEKTLSFEADDFVCKKGPVIFNDLRSGVFYNARLEE